MEIIIKEPDNFFGEDYQIVVNETKEQFTGRNKGFYVFDDIFLFQDNREIIRAKRRFRPFRKKYYDISYAGKIGQFKQLTWFKTIYEVNLNGKILEVVQHWGNRLSIFENGRQVGSIEQLNKISFNNNDTFRLLVDNDQDYIPFILLVMILDAPGNESFSKNNLIMLQTGNISGEKIPFDENWKPS